MVATKADKMVEKKASRTADSMEPSMVDLMGHLWDNWKAEHLVSWKVVKMVSKSGGKWVEVMAHLKVEMKAGLKVYLSMG